MLKNFKLVRLSVAAFMFIIVTGCGSQSSSGAPLGGSIAINPSAVTWAVAGVTATTLCTPGATPRLLFSVFNVTILDANNRPQSGTDFDVALDLAVGTTSMPGDIALHLYDDPSWLAGSLSPPTNEISGLYQTKTGDFGSKQLIVGMYAGCVYKGYLNVYSGTLFAQVPLSITAGGS